MPRLHDRFPEVSENLPYLPLGSGPSPVRRLGIETADGAEVWLKDESAYGDGPWGGNKIRKLEWILPDVRRRGARTILTFGALGTNHGLATALYAREHGLGTAIALIDQPRDEHVERQLERLESCGARLYRTRRTSLTVAAAPWLVLRHMSGLRPPYLLPPGGSSPVGTLGYVEASFELALQVRAGALPEPSHVVCAMGSGGTAAGLLLGLRLAGLRTRVAGVVVNDTLPLGERAITTLAHRTARLLRRRGAGELVAPAARGLLVIEDQLGEGYGHATAASREALAVGRESEHIELDPVYTAKAFAAVIAGRFGGGPVLFLHTHGARAA